MECVALWRSRMDGPDRGAGEHLESVGCQAYGVHSGTRARAATRLLSPLNADYRLGGFLCDPRQRLTSTPRGHLDVVAHM